MSIFLKRISLMLLLMVLVSGCAKKLPPQVSEGKAFSDQPYVVQGNIQYNVEEYRVGTGMGKNRPAGKQLYTSIKIKVTNIGTTEESLKSDDFSLKENTQTYPLSKVNPQSLILKPIKPNVTKESWLIFQVPEEPKGQKELLIKQAKIIIE